MKSSATAADTPHATIAAEESVHVSHMAYGRREVEGGGEGGRGMRRGRAAESSHRIESRPSSSHVPVQNRPHWEQSRLDARLRILLVCVPLASFLRACVVGARAWGRVTGRQKIWRGERNGRRTHPITRHARHTRATTTRTTGHTRMEECMLSDGRVSAHSCVLRAPSLRLACQLEWV